MTFYCISPHKVYAFSSPSSFFLRPDPAFPHRVTPGAARLGQEAQVLCADCATYAHKEVSGKNSCSPKKVFISFLHKTSKSIGCPVLVWADPFFTYLCPRAFRGSVAMLTILFIYLLSSGRSFYSSLCLSVGLH